MKDTSSALSEKEVSQFLQDNPDFFEKHPQLLADISLPHESGEAVSLVERQVALLRERNIDMRHRLAKLLDNARENDALFENTRRLVLALVEARSLTDAVDTLYTSFDRDFDIPFTSLIIFADPSRVPETRARIQPLHQAREPMARIISTNKTLCGDLPGEEVQFLFSESAGQIGSAAVTPLVHGNCFGLLAIGNPDPQHYRSSMGTLFLSHIGEVLNRVLPCYL